MAAVTVVIRTFNEEKHIGRLLAGIYAQSLTSVEVIVVDSGSSDSTLAIASRFPVRIVSIRPQEFSFGRSLNRGCEVASGEFLVFASAHVYPVLDTWLERMVAPFSDPAIALTYGRQQGNEVTKFAERQIFAKWFPGMSCHDQGHPFCNNANAAIRRVVWEQIRFDEDLTGLEDVDWAKRAMALGYGVSYVAEAPVVHVHEERYQQTYNRYRREAIAHARIMGGQRFSLWDFVQLTSANILSDYFHALVHAPEIRHFASIPLFRLAQFWGTYRGFHHHGEISRELKRRFYYPNRMERDSAAQPLLLYGHPIDYGGSVQIDSSARRTA